MDVSLDLQPRQKGLLWYSTYRVRFSGLYRSSNDTDHKQDVTLNWRYPAQKAIFDDLSILLDGQPCPSRIRAEVRVSRRPTGLVLLEARRLEAEIKEVPSQGHH